VLWVLAIELLSFVVLKLRMVNHFLWDGQTTPKEYALDVKIWLVTIDPKVAEAVLTHSLHTLKETVKHVVGHVHFLTLAFYLFVRNLPDGPSCFVEHLPECRESLGDWVVGVELFPLVKYERCLWEEI